MSSSYVYYREVTLEDDVLNITTNNGEASTADKILEAHDSKSKSWKSEPNLLDENHKHPAWKSKSTNSLNYDGDTDSINEEADGRINYEDIKLKCTICDIEYNAYLEFPTRNDTTDGLSVKKVRRHRRRRQRKSMNDADGEESKKKVNFEDYKDWSHRMEEFDPKAERKWTLEYEVDDELPRLSKIIIGRGHENEFPELNNIHLFDDVKAYEKASWRNSMLNSLKTQNMNVKSKFSLVPSNQTCLFCFSERQGDIRRSLAEGNAFASNTTESGSAINGNDNILSNGIPQESIKDSSIPSPKALSVKTAKQSKLRAKIDTKKIKNVFTGKAITNIMRSRKQHFENSVEVDGEIEDDDDEDFEVI